MFNGQVQRGQGPFARQSPFGCLAQKVPDTFVPGNCRPLLFFSRFNIREPSLWESTPDTPQFSSFLTFGILNSKVPKFCMFAFVSLVVGKSKQFPTVIGPIRQSQQGDNPDAKRQRERRELLGELFLGRAWNLAPSFRESSR
jgi:hypothetical protein